MLDKKLGESEGLNCWHKRKESSLGRDRWRLGRLVAWKGLKETINWQWYHSAQFVMHNLTLHCIMTY